MFRERSMEFRFGCVNFANINGIIEIVCDICREATRNYVSFKCLIYGYAGYLWVAFSIW